MKGFVPTPETAVDSMVAKLFQHRDPTEGDRVLDPGSGRGAFVEGIIRYCSRRKIALPTIVAVESDPKHAAFLRNQYADLSAVSIRETDFLSTSLEGFDFVIGNPPYVSISGLDEAEKSHYRRQFATAVGRFDLYILFFEKALSALRRGGRLVFITPEKFLYVNTAAPLRKILSSLRVTELHYFPEDTFQNFVTYPLVTVVEAAEPNGEMVVTERNGTVRLIDAQMSSSSWLPVVRRAGAASEAPKLREISRRISCGVATGADSVFTVKRTEIPSELVPYAYPTLSGRDVTSIKLPEWHQFMLVPYRSDGSLVPESELGPLGAYLNDHRRQERLLRRTCVQSKPWYAFHENPPLKDILRPKLLCKDIGAKPLFVIDRKGEIVPRHSLYYIVPRNSAVLDELAEFLNSHYVARWLADHCQRAANGFLRLQSHVLKELPLTPDLQPEPTLLSLTGDGRRTA